MQIIDIRGFIVPDEDVLFYRFFGYSVVCPRDVLIALNKAGGEEVTIRINSYGGDVWSGSEIYTLLRSYEGAVNVEVTGLAASAASVIMMAGNTVRASPTSEIMIHNPSSRAEGDYRAMEQAAKSLRNTREAIVNAYQIKTALDRTRIRAMMNAETWMTAQSAVENGFADEIMFVESGKIEIDDAGDGIPGSDGAVAKAAAFSMPSARELKARYAVWQEIAPSATTIDEARAMIVQQTPVVNAAETQNEPKTEPVANPAINAEPGKQDNGAIEMIRARIKAIAI